MNLSTRSRMSLIQFLRKMARQDAALLLTDYGIVAQDDESQAAQEIEGSLTEIILRADVAALSDVVQELARTRDAVRSTVQPKYVHDQRWAELVSWPRFLWTPICPNRDRNDDVQHDEDRRKRSR